MDDATLRATRRNTLNAVAAFQRNPIAVIEIVMQCEDPAVAIRQVADLLECDETAATAVMTTQVMHLTRRRREQVQQEIASLNP